MAQVQHKDILDPEIHEPKGVAAAGEGDVYVADGLGSGSWKPGTQSAYGCLRLTSDQTTLGLTTSYQAINLLTLGVNWTSATISSNISADVANGYLQVSDNGDYYIDISLSIRAPAGGKAQYAFTLGIDSGAGIVEKSSFLRAFTSTDAVGIQCNVALTCIPQLTAGDKLYIMMKADTGTVKEVDVRAINFTVNRVN
jgi:hypothetical protein